MKKMILGDDGKFYAFTDEKKVEVKKEEKVLAIDVEEVKSETGESVSEIVEATDAMTVKELKLECKSRGIEFKPRETKKGLLELLNPVDL